MSSSKTSTSSKIDPNQGNAGNLSQNAGKQRFDHADKGKSVNTGNLGGSASKQK